MKQFLLLPLLFAALFAVAQKDYLKEGETLFQNNQFAEAEVLFREALTTDAENVNYMSQLGVCLIQQGKHDEAQKVLSAVLAKDASNFSALWYSGVSCYTTKKYSSAVPFFDKVLPLLDQASPQYPSAYWFIGKSYSGMLKTTGITSTEADRMFEAYGKYLELQPSAHDAEKIKIYVAAAKANRPATISDKWIAK